jgi:hypothetical protein
MLDLMTPGENLLSDVTSQLRSELAFSFIDVCATPGKLVTDATTDCQQLEPENPEFLGGNSSSRPLPLAEKSC